MAVNRLNDLGFLDGKQKSRYFKEALSGALSSPEFPDLKISTCHDLLSLWIFDVEMLALAAPFEFALVEKFICRRPPVDTIRKFFFQLKLIGHFSVTLLKSKNILIKLLNDLDYCRVFSHRSYFVNNCYFNIFKWTLHFDITIESPTIPIWVSFPNLQSHLFSPRILHGHGSLFDHPLRIDNATSNGLRPSVSHILVELDVTKRYPD
ncbi:hypothetical protein KFK09_023135 [Dendrobium nobile]|uniref:DUF4283 domain-containing protein n=1 Tax=Dendrobium nobile TaxID=94219 RepID=A0A8T3ALG6_DENNO|nr:hypothetical protein KFK09_023135 [Dendrobium nobile]